MTALQNIDARAEQKINQLMPFLVKTAGGDPDLIQEGAIALWETIQKAPDATDGYYRTKAKWSIIGKIRGVGRSVDIPKAYPRKMPVSIVHYDADLSDSVLADRRRVPIDEYVIQKMDFEQFINTLTSSEAGYIRMKMVEGLADHEASKRMDVTPTRLCQMKKALRGKIEAFFTW
ncbi:MAG: sigma-70 family RNA polymerase sigma factor [Desulfobacterales bacterium]|nr:sigma-70 family RNA polymerase sigma factor [Desulfobacterales bacterium]